jgi:hypothetical protein
MVTQRSRGGFLPSYAQVKQGVVYQHGKPVPMPEEQDFFRFCGLPYIDPPDRDEAAQTPKELYGRYLGLR